MNYNIIIKPTSDFLVSNHHLENEIVLRNNRWIFLFMLVSMVVASYGVLQINDMISVILSIIFGFGALVGLVGLFDRNIQFKLDDKGIFIKGQGKFKWKDLKNTYIEIKPDGSEGGITVYNLILEFKNGSKTIVGLGFLNKDPEWIAGKIEGFRIRYSDIGLVYKLKR